METKSTYSAIVIGGSAGSFHPILEILQNLPKKFPIPIIITLHRLKTIHTGLKESVSIKSHIPIREPYDRQKIKPAHVYFAPSNYHLYIEPDYTFSLSTEELIEYSRPSIDVLFKSAAKVYGSNLLGIILSGANKDGSEGLKQIQEFGGTTIIQDPHEAEVQIMPNSAIELTKPDYILTIKNIIDFLQKLY